MKRNNMSKEKMEKVKETKPKWYKVPCENYSQRITKVFENQ